MMVLFHDGAADDYDDDCDDYIDHGDCADL